MWIYALVSALIALYFLERTIALWRHHRRNPGLAFVPPDGPGPLPSLSIVVPALNEEATVERAMRTLLAVDYPDLEILAVDDRSTDRTGAILDRLAAEDPRLKVVHVAELPPGWLGKTHAMHVASQGARGEWILFTDADIHFEPTALRRALRRAIDRRLDHLVVLPEVIAIGFWERVILGYFWTMFTLASPPDRVANPGSRAHVGVGAFNLVRASAYRRAGGHASMPMEVLDDVRLGKRMKLSGGRQESLPGSGLVRVRWQEGLGGIVDGLTKNLFAALRFSLPAVLAATVMTFLGTVWPPIGLLWGPWWVRLCWAISAACLIGTLRAGGRMATVPPIYGFTFPLGGLIFLYIIWRSMLTTYARGGIVWRGTHYPLRDLRKGLV